MVKVAQMNIPPAIQPLLDKLLSAYDNQIYPTWATRYFHTTRSAKVANKAKTYIPGVRAVWATLTTAQKAQWRTASSFMAWTNYQYYTAKYSYHKKHGLSFPITVNQNVQMYGLKLCNPSGLETVRAVRDDIVLTGQITASFKYKKTEIEPAISDPFGFHADLYYFEGGENKIETHDWSAPAGLVDWTAVSETFGTAGRYYFHSIITFKLDYYNADILLDNFLVSDNLGDVYREAWKVKDGKPWEPIIKSRKQGWTFSPVYAEPYFQIEYVDD